MISKRTFIVILSLGRVIPAWGLISLASLPITIRSIVTARAHYDSPSAMVSANAGTVVTHAVTGLLLALAYPILEWLSPLI